MGEANAGGQILIASNRGPVSFTQGDDGVLTAKRGGGGMVSGLSTVAEDADMLWVCAALSDADRAAARAAPGGVLDHAQAGSGAAVRMLDIPPDIFERAYNSVANSTLWFVHHMLYDTPNSPSFGPDFAPQWQAFRSYNEMFASALAVAAARPGRQPGSDPGLSPLPRAADAGGPGTWHSDRALLSHAVGTARLLPDTARRYRPPGAGRHPGCRPCRLPVPALGRQLHRLLRGAPWRRRRPRPQPGRATAVT